MIEVSGEMIAGAGAAIVGASGLAGAVLKALWDKMRDGDPHFRDLPCGMHTAMLEAIQRNVAGIESWLEKTSDAVWGIREDLARLNGRVGRTEERLEKIEN